jgi:hypothetical protein
MKVSIGVFTTLFPDPYFLRHSVSSDLSWVDDLIKSSLREDYVIRAREESSKKQGVLHGVCDNQWLMWYRLGDGDNRYSPRRCPPRSIQFYPAESYSNAWHTLVNVYSKW